MNKNFGTLLFKGNFRKNIYIYNDKGSVDVDKLKKFVQEQFAGVGVNVAFVNAKDVWDGRLDDSVLAFFMPGGKADEYFSALWGAGNDKIRDYVANGGVYLGICAGAYYACRDVKFNDGEKLKNDGRYGLDLFNGVARGTLYKELGISKFTKNPSSMAIVDLMDVSRNDKAERKTGLNSVGQPLLRFDYASLYHGGPFFDNIEGEFEPVADYVFGKDANGDPNRTKHAIVASQFGLGRVILSGVHFEVGPSEMGELLPFMLGNRDYLRVFNDIRAKEYRRQKLLFNLMAKVCSGR